MNCKALPHSALLFILTVLWGCQQQQPEIRLEKTAPVSGSELIATMEANVDSFYAAYERFDNSWLDFFEEEFTNAFPDTPIRSTSKNSTKALWEGIYSRYDVQLIARGKPSFIASNDMVISHNAFHEIFISKASGDTTNVAGTYVLAWRRQPDKTWKIAFESVLNSES